MSVSSNLTREIISYIILSLDLQRSDLFDRTLKFDHDGEPSNHSFFAGTAQLGKEELRVGFLDLSISDERSWFLSIQLGHFPYQLMILEPGLSQFLIGKDAADLKQAPIIYQAQLLIGVEKFRDAGLYLEKLSRSEDLLTLILSKI